VLAEYVTPPADWLRTYLPPSACGFDLGEEDFWLDEPSLIGPSMAFPRRSLLAVGGFDSIGATGTRGGVGEEPRVQRKLFNAGWRGRYVAQARVWHYVPPENCSPEWALRRAYRHGLTASLSARQQGRRPGVQRWMIRRVVVLEAQCRWARLRGRSLSERFSMERERAWHHGVMAGCRDGNNPGEKASATERANP